MARRTDAPTRVPLGAYRSALVPPLHPDDSTDVDDPENVGDACESDVGVDGSVLSISRVAQASGATSERSTSAEGRSLLQLAGVSAVRAVKSTTRGESRHRSRDDNTSAQLMSNERNKSNKSNKSLSAETQVRRF